ncbi:MAG: hypothetical protein JKX99_10580 [Robiginitomaculum sp.]|nr:hypothetical protein [Robiginitomaculum sp.]
MANTQKITRPVLMMALVVGVITPASASAENGFTINPRGRIFFDIAAIDYNLTNLTTNITTSEARTARLGVQGTFGKNFSYVAEFDGVGGDIQAQDLIITAKFGDGWAVVVGNQKPANSIEEQTSGRYLTFMERAAITDATRLSRNLGVNLTKKGDNYHLAAGVFTSNINTALIDGNSLITDEFVIAGRASFAPINEKNHKLHLGIHARYFDGAPSLNLSFRARPNVHLSQRLLSVRNQGDSSTLVGVEAAWVKNAFHLHGEWMQEDANDRVQGGFVQAGWFITGEHRNYGAGSSKFGRTKPNKALSDGGYGAFEIAARYDWTTVDGRSNSQIDNWTLGFNWYLEDKVRIVTNLVHSSASGIGASFGGGSATIGQVRFQLDW